MSSDLDLHGLRIMLVEDEFALALGLADLVVEHGGDIIGPVASASDALDLLDKLPEIDAAILDVNLERGTTYPVADALMRRGIPFFFATASHRAQLPDRFARVPLCQKPFSLQEFHTALAACVPAARRHAEARRRIAAAA